jgi:hypothetical protein
MNKMKEDDLLVNYRLVNIILSCIHKATMDFRLLYLEIHVQEQHPPPEGFPAVSFPSF